MRTLQTLNVYSISYGICLAHKLIDEKTDEIPAAQEVLKYMDLKGSIVTADSMNFQLDVTFRDDKNTSMAKTGAKNLQIMKKIVMAILKIEKDSYG